MAVLVGKLSARRSDSALNEIRSHSALGQQAPIGVTTRKCSERPARANNARTHAASSEGFLRSGLSRPSAGGASSVQM